jgi:hypothetical protein
VKINLHRVLDEDSTFIEVKATPFTCQPDPSGTKLIMFTPGIDGTIPKKMSPAIEAIFAKDGELQGSAEYDIAFSTSTPNINYYGIVVGDRLYRFL